MDFSWILNHSGFPQGLIPQPPINRQDFQQSHDLCAGGRFERQNSEICRHNLGRRGQIFLLCSQSAWRKHKELAVSAAETMPAWKGIGDKTLGFTWQRSAGWEAGYGGIPLEGWGWHFVTFPFSSGWGFSSCSWLCFPAAFERQQIRVRGCS